MSTEPTKTTKPKKSTKVATKAQAKSAAKTAAKTPVKTLAKTAAKRKAPMAEPAEDLHLEAVAAEVAPELEAAADEESPFTAAIEAAVEEQGEDSIGDPIGDETDGEAETSAEAEDDADDEEADPEFVPKPRPPAKLERLQKILAQAGIASRRKAEEMIEQGRVQVNGKTVTELGTKADAGRDHVRVDGKLLQGAERLRYYVLNKPKGFVTTVKDPEGRATVMQFFEKMKERLYPVGRLDYMSEGLLVVTNDGELANRLTRAASGVEKTYLVKVAGQPTEDELDRLRSGVSIERGKPGSGKVRTSPARIRQVRQGDNPWYEVVLIEGRNRELRKMFEEVGHFVEKIRRIGYGPLVLDQEPGNLRELDEQELDALRKTAEGKLRTPKSKELRRRNALDAAALPTVAPRATRPRAARPDTRTSGAGSSYQPKRAFSNDRPGRPFQPASDQARPTGQSSRPESREGFDRAAGQDRRPGTFVPNKFGTARPTGGRPAARPAWQRDDRTSDDRSSSFRPVRPAGQDRSSGQDRPSGRDFGQPRPSGRDSGQGFGAKNFTDRPAAKKSFGDRPAGRTFDKPTGRPFTPRPFAERPAPAESASETPTSSRPFAGKPASDRPSPGRSFGDKPRSFGDRPEKKSWSKPAGREFGQDSGKGYKGKPTPFQRADDDYSDLEPRKPVKIFIEPIQESERSSSSRSSGPRASGPRPSAPRPYAARPSSDRPQSDRAGSDRPSAPRSYSDRSSSDRSGSDRPSPSRPYRAEGGPGSGPGGGLERRFTTSSGKPRPGGARPSSKPGKSFGSGARSGSGPRGGSDSRPSYGSNRPSGSGGGRPGGSGFSRPSTGQSRPAFRRDEGEGAPRAPRPFTPREGSDYRPTQAKPYPNSTPRAERKAGSDWKPKTRYGGSKSGGSGKPSGSGFKPGGGSSYKPKPGGGSKSSFKGKPGGKKRG